MRQVIAIESRFAGRSLSFMGETTLQSQGSSVSSCCVRKNSPSNSVQPVDLLVWHGGLVDMSPSHHKRISDEIFHIQVTGLARRLEQIGTPPVAIGVSGGLDSTLSLLVLCKTLDSLGVPRDRVRGKLFA